MANKLEVLFDENPSGGCGCNCGCGGSSVVEDMNDLVETLKEYNFGADLTIDVLPISNLESEALISKINALLDRTNATFRVNEETIEETLSNMLPLIALDGAIITAFGVPTLYDVVLEVNKVL